MADKTITSLTDKQFAALKTRLDKIGKTKLIDRLENEMINANLAGDSNKAERCEVAISWARKQSDWGKN